MTIHKILTGDCRSYIPGLPDNSIHSVVTDPPYEIGFMGSDWDQSGIAFDVDLWKQIYKKMTPGAHLIAFSFTTTYDLLVHALRKAGFIIKNMLFWHYGSGFPKGRHIANYMNGSAKDEWHDWHTQLKPTTEPAALVMKPMEPNLTVEQNVLLWGTGALNIGACRVPVNPGIDKIGVKTKRKTRISASVFSEESCGYDNEENLEAGVVPEGRFASNLVLSHDPSCVLVDEGNPIEPKLIPRSEVLSGGRHGIYGQWIRQPTETVFPSQTEIWACVPGCPIRMIDDQGGFGRASGPVTRGTASRDGKIFKDLPERTHFPSYKDKGGKSRFFYCAKASPNENVAV